MPSDEAAFLRDRLQRLERALVWAESQDPVLVGQIRARAAATAPTVRQKGPVVSRDLSQD
jgi:hypothetical protein